MSPVEALFAFGRSEIVRFALIACRVTPLMMVAPIWGSPLVPGQVRVLIAVGISALLLPAARGPLPPGVFDSLWPLAWAVAGELLLGFLFAYVALLLMAGAQFAGQLIDIQIGFGIANVLDPLTSAQVTLIGQMQYLAALFLFLLMDGHHLLLRGLADTFAAVPPGTPFAGAAALELVVRRGGSLLFVIAARIAAPALTALFLTNFALGLASRMMPQMNLFMVGMPVNVGAGLLALAASLTLFAAAWRGALGDLTVSLSALTAALRVRG